MAEPHLDTQTHIGLICDEVKQLLIDKNKKYGDSALQPSRIFSKAGPIDQILVRIDDKLNRIKQGAGLVANDEDVIMDLIGYLVLLKIALIRNQDQWTTKNLLKITYLNFSCLMQLMSSKIILLRPLRR